MGKGDQRTRRGKLFRGTNGKTRLKHGRSQELHEFVRPEPVRGRRPRARSETH